MQIPDDIQETLDEIFDDSPVDKQLRIKFNGKFRSLPEGTPWSYTVAPPLPCELDHTSVLACLNETRERLEPLRQEHMKVSFLPKAQKEIEAEIAAKVAQLGTGFHKIEPNVPALAVVCALFPKEVTKHLVAANATAGGGITSKDRAKRLEALDDELYSLGQIEEQACRWLRANGMACERRDKADVYVIVGIHVHQRLRLVA